MRKLLIILSLFLFLSAESQVLKGLYQIRGISAPPVTSYANSGGTGNRTSIITVTTGDLSYQGGTLPELVDGAFANTLYWNNQSVVGIKLIFDFGTPRIIDEAKFYQDISSTQGTWQWAGTQDGINFTLIGSAFVLGGSAYPTAQVITELNGNTTAYRYYYLSGVSGNASNAAWTYEFEFKIY